MKKDRNTFFNEASFSQSGYIPTPNFSGNGMPMNGGFSGSQTGMNFYSGPSPMGSMGYNQNNMGNDYMNDIESRLAKIERQMNRLDARISKLESKGFVSTEQIENNTNMYML